MAAQAPSNPLYLICGESQSGKTVTSFMLREQQGLATGNCSDAIFIEAAQRLNITEDALRQRNKEEIRPFLMEVGNNMAATVRTALVDKLVSNGVRAIAGVRRELELKEAVEKYRTQGFQVTSLYIDRPNRPHTVKDNNEITPNMCDLVIANHADLEHLWLQVRGIGQSQPNNPPGGKSVIIVRGLDLAERAHRLRAIGGAPVNGALPNALAATEAALAGPHPIICVHAAFNTLHSMKPFVSAALGARARVELSEPAKVSAAWMWHKGTLRDILNSRSQDERRQAAMRLLASSPSPRESAFSRMEFEAHIQKFYANEIDLLLREGHFQNKDTPGVGATLDPLSQKTSRLMAGMGSTNPFAQPAPSMDA